MIIGDLLAVEPWFDCCYGIFEDGSVGRFSLDKMQNIFRYEKLPDEIWHNISFLDSSRSHIVGLRTDGTVAVYAKGYRFDEYKNWTNIIQTCAGYELTAGLKSDGTVLYEYSNSPGGKCCDLRNIRLITSMYNSLVGVDFDGALFQVENRGKRILGYGWDDVESITATLDNIFGLKKDGKIISIYENTRVQNWRDIIQIDSGHGHIIGLTKDGNVEADGENTQHQCHVRHWNNIKKISAGCYQTAGINKEGKILTTYNIID